MRSAPEIFVSEDVSFDASMPKDDIDTLFDKLQSIEPPQSLILRILEFSKNTSSMPLLSTPALRNPWEELDSLAFRNDKRNPC
jgi:hypothetical protein